VLSPSGFAYSMIYPYSDNYLDAPEVSSVEKKMFSRRLERRLYGETVRCESDNESKLSALVDLIEGEFARSRFEGVYESLLAIHHAQSAALRQQGNDDLSPDELLMLSVEKGGTSVLADGFLADGALGFDEGEFLFGFGVSLQLIDDLQDIEEDLANGHTSLFTLAAELGLLDGIVNRLLNYGETIMSSPGLHDSSDARGLVHMIERSSKALIFESIAKNPQLFSRTYVEKIERHSPVSFEYLRTMEKNRRSAYETSQRVRLAVA
jgi:hypothetical protein